MKRIVTLTTDFGTEDHYVGVLKGVILSINSEANIIDITHSVDSHSILPAAYIIKNSYSYFPEGTIHVAVVDPGVGSDRQAILVSYDNHFFIGPDNGIFSLIFSSSSEYEVFQLKNENYFFKDISSTFHGRDIFSPVAAHLSNGVLPSEFGEKLISPQIIHLNEYLKDESSIKGEVIYTDKFGNLVTNIPSGEVGKNAKIILKNKVIHGVSDFYSEVDVGELLAIRGSNGYLEIAINKGDASKLFDEDKLDIMVRY